LKCGKNKKKSQVSKNANIKERRMKRLSNLRKCGISRILLTLFLMLAAAPAQEKNWLEQRVQKLQKELNLTEEQSGQVRQILEYNQQQAQKEREGISNASRSATAVT